jgi:hypothetical protein
MKRYVRPLSRFEYPRQQISQSVARQHYPSVSNPARTNNVTRRKHGSRCDRCTALISTPRTPDKLTIAVSNLRRNLEALLCPRLKVGARKFGKLALVKLLAVSERRKLVS